MQVGVKGGPFPVPLAEVYRSMAIFGTQGFSVLPKHCDIFMAAFFTLGVSLHVLRDFVVPRRYVAEGQRAADSDSLTQIDIIGTETSSVSQYRIKTGFAMEWPALQKATQIEPAVVKAIWCVGRVV